jgi:hypothetical protein
LEEQNR